MLATLPVLDGPGLLPAAHPPRTRYPKSVIDVPAAPRKSTGLRCLVSGASNAKLGGTMLKGRWRGMPLYALTLEERATCPTDCPNWDRCYGNNMPFAQRYRPGAALEAAIRADVHTLAERRASRTGFVVRLHVLGDFYSVPYVWAWGALFEEVPQLHAYGYTHHQHGTPIGDAIAELVARFPERASFLRSDPRPELRESDPLPGAYTVDWDAPLPATGTVFCPEQQGRAPSCASCGLCMNGRTGVSFVDHSRAALDKRRAASA